MNIQERVNKFKLDDIRGIAYKPGPLAIDGSQNPQKEGGSYFENVKGGLDVKYTIYYDSDFYNSDFDQLWSGNGGGRDDLRRFKEQLNVNFVHLYDWNPGAQAGAPNVGKMRNHIPFLDYANSLGLKVTIPISNDQMNKAYCSGNMDLARANAQNMFNEIYGSAGTTPHPAAGVLKIFNEPDASECKNVRLVADACAIWKSLEDQRAVPDENRLPIIFPVTYGIHNGIAGGGMLPAWQAIRDNSALGQAFWMDRIIFATNPFNAGSEMRNWLTQQLPAWFAQNGIPSGTPIMFAEYGRSSDESTPPTEQGQAEWVDEQFALLQAKPAGFLGACLFLYNTQFWKAPPEPNFTATDFVINNGGSSTWPAPANDFAVNQTYWNPNGNNGAGAIWDWNYNVQRLSERPSYWKVALATNAPRMSQPVGRDSPPAIAKRHSQYSVKAQTLSPVAAIRYW